MSKQQQCKDKQQYVPKAIPQTCGACRHCVPVMGEVLMYKDPLKYAMGGTHVISQQVSQKCGIGGFVVKKMGTCSVWVPLLPDNAEITAR